MRDSQGRPSYPVRFINGTDETIPAWGVIRLRGGQYDIDDVILYPEATHPTGDASDALYVNSATPVEPGGDGHCRSVRDDPFWVTADPSLVGGAQPGSQIGPIRDRFFVYAGKPGFTVIYRDTESKRYLCAAAISTEYKIVQLRDDLEECGESADGYFVLDEECFDWNIGEELSGAANFVEVCPSAGWKGVAFGGKTFQEHGISQPGPCEWGDIILVRREGEKWLAVGAGHLALTGTADDAVEEFAEGQFTVDVKIGDCHYGYGGGAVQPCPDGETREKTITAKVLGGDVSEGQAVTLTWRGNGWDAAAVNVEAGCGLRIEESAENGEENPDAGKIRIDEDIAGCGLEWDEDNCQLKADPDDLAWCGLKAGANDCDLDVDNTALAGSNLDTEGECALKVSDDLIDRIEALEACCEENRACCDTLTDIVNDLIECCEDNRDCCYESMLCCYDNTESIDYIGDYCCDGVPGTGDCDTKCLWRWPEGATTTNDWDLIVPCAGEDCECSRPTEVGTEVGDQAFSDCNATGGAGCCDGTDDVTELTATISEVSNCACGGGVTVTMEQSEDCETGAAMEWQGTADFCGTTISLRFICDGTDDIQNWSLLIEFFDNCVSPREINPDAGATTDPIVANFSDIAIASCCGGTDAVIDIIIEE